MAISYDDAKALLDELDPDYSGRHLEHKKLRDFWHGRYWDDVDSQAHGVASIFRDVASAKSDVGPDIKLVRNLVFDVCLKYQSFLSGTPMIRTFVDRESRPARAQAALKERALYATWSQAEMSVQLNRIAWFGPLMGDSFLGIWPDFDCSSVKAIVRSPEHAFPVPNFDGTGLDAILFCWKTTAPKAKRAFPSYTGKGSDSEGSKTVEVLEYSDTTQFVRWVGTQQTNRVEHNLGFNLFDQVPFIRVPGEAWNHGAVEQSVNLVQAGNALYSLVMQAMLENVFPRLILEDPMKFGEDIDTGPGAVIPTNPGGKAYYLVPPNASLGEGVALLQETERSIKQGTSMPDVNFGQFDASIITGKAVNALQGAGTGSVVEMVQGAGIGGALTAWNEKALTIYQRMFRDDQINLYGVRPSSMVDLNPAQFALSFKGREIVGSPRNEVVFSPYIDQHGKLVMGLQALGAGLVSKEHAREQIGISDSEQMQEEITGEVIEEAVVGAMVQALMADPSEDNADSTQARANAYLSGKPGQPGLRAPATPQPPPGAPPAGAGGGPSFGSLPGGGQTLSPALELPPGSPPPVQAGAPVSAPSPAGPPPAGVTLPAAVAALSHADLVGRAWLVGEIVARGKADAVEVAVTDPADKDALAQAAQFPVTFHVVSGVPREEAVEIGTSAASAA